MGSNIGYSHDFVESAGECQFLCNNNELCYFWSYDVKTKECDLKNSDSGWKQSPGHVSGPKVCSKMKFKFWKFNIPILLIN